MQVFDQSCPFTCPWIIYPLSSSCFARWVDQEPGCVEVAITSRRRSSAGSSFRNCTFMCVCRPLTAQFQTPPFSLHRHQVVQTPRADTSTPYKIPNEGGLFKVDLCATCQNCSTLTVPYELRLLNERSQYIAIPTPPGSRPEAQGQKHIPSTISPASPGPRGLTLLFILLRGVSAATLYDVSLIEEEDILRSCLLPREMLELAIMCAPRAALTLFAL